MEMKWIFNVASSKIKDGTYIINFNEYADTGTHWITLFCNKNEIVYSIVLVLSIFLKKLKNLLKIKK